MRPATEEACYNPLAMKQLHALLPMLLLIACGLPAPLPPAATAAPPTRVLAAPVATPGDGIPFGVNSHIVSRYGDCSTLDRPADVLAGASAGWAREDFQFSSIGRVPDPAGWRWECADAAVEALSSRNIAVLGVLGGPVPGWSVGEPGGPDSRRPPDVGAFAQFAGAAAARYAGRVAAWQIWNEPDNPLYWSPTPDPAAYAALLQAASSAIRNADPAARILSGGLVSPDPARGFLEALHAAGAWEAFDIVAVNPYADPWGPEEGQIGAMGVGAVKALVDRLGPKPIWATEFGWSSGPADRTREAGASVDEATQADYLVRSAALVRAAGAERVFWYSLKDSDPANNLYGLVGFGAGPTDFAPERHKPALAALRALAYETAGAQGVELRMLGEAGVAVDFEQFGEWRRGDQPNGTLTPSSEQVHGGGGAARLDYSFPSGDNDFVAFLPAGEPALPGAPDAFGAWVYGDGGGHELKVWLRDAAGEVLQYRLGVVGGPGWQFLHTGLDAPVAPWNRPVAGGGPGGANFVLDPPASLVALILDDAPDGFTGAGTIFLDDLTSIQNTAYSVRFARGDHAVDLIWALRETPVRLPTRSREGRLADRSGAARMLPAEAGELAFSVGPAPVFLTHTPP
jgi:polysaccharide biosynthesis protein PslG